MWKYAVEPYFNVATLLAFSNDKVKSQKLSTCSCTWLHQPENMARDVSC